MLIMGKAKPPEVVETSGGFCSVYVRWFNPLGCYCLSFLPSHLQMKELATFAITETKKVIIELVMGLHLLSAGGSAATAL